jgi:WXXGXW repeat (2 copies)
MKPASIKIAIAGALMSIALSACVVAPAPGYGEVVAYQAPPAPQYEVVGVAPTPGYFWIGGAWFWEGGRYAWHPGHWEAPRAGYRWVPHAWVRAGGAWHMRPGHWERR